MAGPRNGADDLERVHSVDERIGIREYDAAIRLYRQLIVEWAGR